MKRALAAMLILAIIIAASFAVIFIENNRPAPSKNPPDAFVGVSYTGNSVAQGEQLINKVKSYTNLFVLQSGLLEQNFESVNELGDYAVAAGMYFLPYFGAYVPSTFSSWLVSAEQKWGSHLLGVYYGDEPGGKMLDSYVYFNDSEGGTITKTEYGDVVVQKPNGIVIQYEINGIINLYQPDIYNKSSDLDNEATFYPNGTFQLVRAPDGLIDFSYSSYQELNSTRPFSNLNDTAQSFIDNDQSSIDFVKINGAKVFTSDYALFWFDYLSGYDVIMGQLGWNLSVTQQIAFIRGAATLQHKDWGVLITWKYDQQPYLDTSRNILKQMTTAYECGAKYLVLFDYYDSDKTPYGTLSEQDFQTLQSFWNNVVTNPKIIQGSIKADTVLVLPENYGWGARWATDHIWGIFPAGNTTVQYWNLMQDVLQEHGLKTDIVYENPGFPLSPTYQNIYRADQL